MKNLTICMCLIGVFAYTSCSSPRAVIFNEKTSTHQRIAVLPFEAHLKLKPEEKATMSDAKLKEIELAQGKEVQDAVESYLANKDLRVTIQSSGVTNSKLRDAGIDIYDINGHDFSKLSKILGVDAVVNGYIETEKPMDEKTATELNIVKNIETAILGTSFGTAINTTTNRGWCRVSIFEGEKGDRLWSYSDDVEMGVGSTTHDVVNRLMRKGVRRFPY